MVIELPASKDRGSGRSVPFRTASQFRVTLSERRGMGLVYDTRNLDKVEFQSPHCIAAVGVMETDHFIKLFFVMIK